MMIGLFSRICRNGLIMLIGPLFTFLLYLTNERPSDLSALLPALKVILSMGAVTLFVSAIGHLFIRDFMKSIVATIIVSESIYILSLLIFFLSDPVKRAENIMWLPIALLFLIPFSLPMALSISYGFGKVIREFKNKQKKAGVGH